MAIRRERYGEDIEECPLRVRNSRPLATSHSVTAPVMAPEARRYPSGEKATDQAAPGCPTRVRNSRPLATSQSLIVSSTRPAASAVALPDASVCPSGENATE